MKLDVQALSLLQQSSLKCWGLLRPTHRTQRVLQAAELDQDRLHIPVANPAGLRLGGALPEFIALSMLAEAHAVLKGANAQSISALVKL